MSKKTTSKHSTKTQTEKRPQATNTKAKATTPIQFDWRKHWNKKVKPHLQNPFVQFAIALGLKMAEPTWEQGDPPYRAGRDWPKRAKKDTLAWYQPFGKCHGISFFSLVIGVINFPELEWKFVSGGTHTVPVGYGQAGQPRVVMDILLFDSMTAEESIGFAIEQEDPRWQQQFIGFETHLAAPLGKVFAATKDVPNEFFPLLLNACVSKMTATALAWIPTE